MDYMVHYKTKPEKKPEGKSLMVPPQYVHRQTRDSIHKKETIRYRSIASRFFLIIVAALPRTTPAGTAATCAATTYAATTPTIYTSIVITSIVTTI